MEGAGPVCASDNAHFTPMVAEGNIVGALEEIAMGTDFSSVDEANIAVPVVLKAVKK